MMPHHYHRTLTGGDDNSLMQLARHIKPGSRVLEIGPATGYFSQYLHNQLECIVDAVECDAEMAKQARPWCRTLIVGDIESLQLKDYFSAADYDVVLLADVLEHLRDPLSVLRATSTLLAEQGQMLISVPNMAYAGLVADLLDGKFRYREEGLLDRTHLRFFTRQSLEELLLEAGLHVWQWQAVERPLWESEFHTRLENLPVAWRDVLLDRQDALCYQWVAAARLFPPSVIPVVPQTNKHDHFPVRLFWRDDSQQFDHVRSKVVWGEVGLDQQQITFVLPEEFAAQFRISLADRPGFVRLRALRLVNTAGEVIWTWHAGQANVLGGGAEGMCVGQMVEGADCCAIIHGESWFNLPLPPDFVSMRGGSLEIELGWPMSGDYKAVIQVVQNQVQQLQKALTTTQDAILQREHLIEERDNLLVLRAGQMEERERMIAERDALLALRTGQIEERGRMIAERDALLALRTGQMEERERLIAERDAFLMQRAEQIAELERLIAERDAFLMRRAEQIAERERLIAERDAFLMQRAEQIAERERMIAERDALLAQRAEQIAVHERMIATLNHELDYRASLAWWIKSPWRIIKRAIKGKP